MRDKKRNLYSTSNLNNITLNTIKLINFCLKIIPERKIEQIKIKKLTLSPVNKHAIDTNRIIKENRKLDLLKLLNITADKIHITGREVLAR